MEQPAKSPDCNPVEHIFDEWDQAIISVDNSPHNIGQKSMKTACNASQKECHDALRRLSQLEAGMPDTVSVYTKPYQQAASYKNSRLFEQIYYNYPPMTFRYAHAANFSNINKSNHEFIKIQFKQKMAQNS